MAYSLVVYYGMSDKLANISYYDSSENYGFTKPYSEERSKAIDEEVSRILSEQYERAKSILTQYAEGHHRLAEELEKARLSLQPTSRLFSANVSGHRVPTKSKPSTRLPIKKTTPPMLLLLRLLPQQKSPSLQHSTKLVLSRPTMRTRPKVTNRLPTRPIKLRITTQITNRNERQQFVKPPGRHRSTF